MKTFLILFAALQFSAMSLAQTITVTVNNGYGSGTYATGDTVHVWSDVYPRNEVFENWTGDASTVVNVNAWHTTLVAPGTNVTITANKISTGPLVMDSVQISGVNNSKKVFYYFDPDPVGTILFFHGGGGSIHENMDRVESNYFLNEARHRNYNLIMINSEDRTLGDPDNDGHTKWDLSTWVTADNVDIGNCSLIIDHFINSGLLDSNTPIHAVGVSNGGNFTHMVAYALDFCSTAMFCAQGGGSDNLFTITNTPTIFSFAVNDPNSGGGNVKGLNNYNVLLDRNIPTAMNMLRVSPLHPSIFMRIPDADSSFSSSMFIEFQSNGLLDQNNFLNVSMTEFQNEVQGSPDNFPLFMSLDKGLRKHVLDQLNVAAADHSMYAVFNNIVFDFLPQDCLETVVINPVATTPEIKIFLNPATNDVYLCFSGPARIERQFRIYNALGKQVHSEFNGQAEVKLITNDLSPGLYFVEVTEGNGSVVRKKIVLAD